MRIFFISVITTLLSVYSISAAVNITETNVNVYAEPDTTLISDENSVNRRERMASVTKKITDLFSAKSDSTAAKPHSSKKENISVSFEEEKWQCWHIEMFEGDNKAKISIGFQFNCLQDGTYEFFIKRAIKGGKNVSVKKGEKVMIRTANGKVYEGTAIKDYASESGVGNKYHLMANYTVMSEAYETHSMIYPQYKFSLDAMNDIEKYGIIKMRVFYGNNPYDVNFTDKRFDKVFSRTSSVLDALKEKMAYIRANYKPRSTLPVVIPEF